MTETAAAGTAPKTRQEEVARRALHRAHTEIRQARGHIDAAAAARDDNLITAETYYARAASAAAPVITALGDYLDGVQAHLDDLDRAGAR